MAKASFANGPAVAAEAEPVAVVVARQGTGAVAVASSYDSGVSGEVDRRDLNMPRMALVQGVGPMSELFKPGQLVLNKETVLTDGEVPVILSVLSIRKSFVENLKYEEDGPLPRRADTLAEVKSLGGTIEYAGDEPPSWIPTADALMLLENDKDDPAFPFEHNGKYYAAAMYSMRKTAYTHAAKAIFTATQYGLKGQQLAVAKWSMSSKRIKIGSNFVYAPVLRQIGKFDDKFIAWVNEMGLGK